MKLRHSLTLGIACVLMIAGAITASIGGYGMRGEVHELLDQHLVQIARLAMTGQSDVFADALAPKRIERRERTRPEISSEERARSISENNTDRMDSGMGAGMGSGDGEATGREVRNRNEDTELIVQRWQGDQVINLLSRHGALSQPVKAGFSDIEFEGKTWVTYTQPTSDGWIVVAQPAEARDELINGAILMAILPSLLALPLAGWVLSWLIGRALQPLQKLSASLEHRPPLSMDPIVTTDLPQETRPLVDAFNGLLMRTDSAIKREHDFIIDAAHALRTPITVLQLQAESLQEARTKADYSERLQDLIAGIARGRHTVEQLLTLARAEQPDQGVTVVDAALKQLPERFNSALQTKNLFLQLNCSIPANTVALLHHDRFNIVIDNLLDNAIRYSLPDGQIIVSAMLKSQHIRISVRDFGMGLSPRETERVFDRFYRPSDDTTSGTGLGLAIVRAICETAGGKVWLEQPIERSGLLAIIELPSG